MNTIRERAKEFASKYWDKNVCPKMWRSLFRTYSMVAEEQYRVDVDKFSRALIAQLSIVNGMSQCVASQITRNVIAEVTKDDYEDIELCS